MTLCECHDGSRAVERLRAVLLVCVWGNMGFETMGSMNLLLLSGLG